MGFGLKPIAFACLAALAFGTAAYATEVDVTIRADSYGMPQRIADYSGEFLGERQHSRREHWHERRGSDRFHERPAPEWREGRPHWHTYRGMPMRDRHVLAGPYRSFRAPCRIVVTERVNRWGEEIQVRREVCR